MIRVDLNEPERKMLRELLERDLADLRMEIAGTDSQDFRDMLKQRKAMISKVLEALKQ